jgi:uncharacterized Rmd1/YagE family protein
MPLKPSAFRARALLLGARLDLRNWPESETLAREVRIDESRPESLQDGVLVLQSASLERLQLVAEALSKSVLLAHYEARIAADFDADRLRDRAHALRHVAGLSQRQASPRKRRAIDMDQARGAASS